MRLQGTDGIRREVRLSTHPSLTGLTPLEAFLQKDIITEEFFELYTYSYVTYLKGRGAMRDGDTIVIGWDPRDKTGSFTGSAVRGIQKAGGAPLCAGAVPTPLVPLFLIAKDAKGGIMITASHNPPDQNGIKLFVKGTGVKPLPADDVNISREVINTSYSTIRELPLKHQKVDCREEALGCFKDFSLDPLNSWKDDSINFENTILVVDPANGAFSQIAAELFELAGFSVVEVSADTREEVNRECGVVEFEGVRIIPSQSIERGEKFADNRAIQAIFENGRRFTEQLKHGELKLCGAVFDADGDRFIRLDYDPFKERVIVSSGDEIAFNQARYLMKKEPDRYRGACYINTVESDLNASIAAKSLGFKTTLTGVGDKWILLETLFLSLDASSSSALNVHLLRKERDLSSEKLSEEVIKAPPAPESIRLAIGAEESGHTITTGLLQLAGERRAVFIGNGFKSAINSFVSTEDMGGLPPDYYKEIEKPFEPGYKKTLYVYYVKKEKMSGPFRETMKTFAEELIRDQFKGGSVSLMDRPEEPDMLYFSVMEKGELRAGVYLRNSGTEDKTGVNLRGAYDDAAILDRVGTALRDVLLLRIKDNSKPSCKTEKEVLFKIQGCGKLAIQELPENIGDVATGRLLKEMQKQGLIKLAGGTLELTVVGSYYIDHLKELKNDTG